MKEEIINFLNNFQDQRNHRVIFFLKSKKNSRSTRNDTLLTRRSLFINIQLDPENSLGAYGHIERPPWPQ